MKRFVIFALLFLGMGFHLAAQHPWAGGLNACQFGRMDLDGDGAKDLLVFDRHGSQLHCFLNKGGTGTVDYQYSDDYDAAFPKLNGWVVFADYDGDGKEDIFTYSPGWAGIKVYKNVSTDMKIDFNLVVAPYLTSWQGGGEVNILATDADYPAIMDLDGDGDLDLVTFGVMGVFLEKHRNLSMELFGCRDSLVFERTDSCWGWVGESEEDNEMYLDTCLFGHGIVMMEPASRHRGATVTIRDMNGDGLLDLILADVDYPGLTLLLNGGDAEEALMVQQIMDFPPSHPVRLFSMPVPFFTDVNNDGVDDLLVSPFDPDPMACEGKESVWLYLNHGTDENPDFHLYTKSFLQSDMIDLGTGAYPFLADLDGDGLIDLVAGTIGDIDSTWYHYGGLETRRTARPSFFKNMGTSTYPVFHERAWPFSLVESTGLMGLVPAAADLDEDGRLEWLFGTAEGKLRLFDHDGTLLDDDFLHYDKPWSAPCFYDVDRDGMTDLVVGNETGKLTFFKRRTENGERRTENGFVRITDFWGGVDVRDYSASYYGHSVPSFFYSGNQLYLCVGSESGKLFLFDGISLDDQAVFEDVSDQWPSFCDPFPESFGMRSSAALADLDGDGRLEIVVGAFAGGLQLFNASIPVNHAVDEYEDEDGCPIMIFPNPVSSQLHIVSNRDYIKRMIIMDLFGRIHIDACAGKEAVSVSVDALNSGIYFVRLETARGWVNRIFLKR